MPSVNDPSDQDLWGGYLNSNLSDQDTQLKEVSDLAAGTTETKTTSFTVTTTDQNTTFLIDATGGNITVTLDPCATLGDGFNVSFKKIDASSFTVILDPNAGETIDGAATYTLTDQYDYIAIRTNGSNWFSESPAGPALATAAETLAGLSSILGMSPAGFAGNKSTNYYKFPGGFVVQWGTGTDDTVVSLPVTYANTDYIVVANWYNNVAAGNSGSGVVIDNSTMTTSSFKAWIGTLGSADTYRWISVGQV